jgi:hypothetical protein
MLKRPLQALLFATFAVTAPAATVTLSFSAPLSHLEEIPVPDLTGGFSPSGSASASVTFDDTNLAAGGLLNAELSWSGLTSEAIMGHIHRITDPTNCRADNPAQCGTGGVLIALFPGNRPATDTLTVTNLSITGGQMTALFVGLTLDPPSAGALYFNVHTEVNQSGEIRGDITGAQMVPEPSTYAMLALGMTMLFTIRSRLADR